jgi:DNA-binding XRE family transcriptional regulator
MEKLQSESGREIGVYREAIEAAKNKYLGEMARLAEASRKSKQQIEAKVEGVLAR